MFRKFCYSLHSLSHASDGRVIVFVNKPVALIRKRGQFLEVKQPTSFFLQRHVFANGKLRALQLVNLKLQNVYKLKLFRFVSLQFVKLPFATMPTMVRISHFSEPRTATREGIEQLEVCFRIEEGLLITLAMNVHKKLAQLTKK